MMENESPFSSEFIPRSLIDEDLQPLYQLTEPQYQSIINRMTNLLGEVAQRLAQDGNTELTQMATEHGHCILRDYDDDVAEAIRWCTQSRSINQLRLGHPRDVDPILPEHITDLPII